MNNKLYVGGLPFAWGEDDLRQLGEEHGEVTSAIIIMDRETNRSKGFGFLEFANEEDAKKAQEALNGNEAGGRKITVDFARPQKER
ncbi:MAG: RNA-binding protein [bacterium]|nr:RNA-binding protein [bacterium]